MIRSILIANRGEIACRVIRTAKRLGVRTVSVYSDADAKALHVRLADEAVHIGPSAASESYLVGEKIIQAAWDTGAEAIHPGYGFLSENAAFAEAVIKAGLIWVGPKPDSIRAMGLKDAAKKLMQEAGVPTTPGYLGEDQAPDRLKSEADSIGYPVLIKAVAGGGGKGMRKVDKAGDFADALASCQREAKSSFGDDRVLLEKWITDPRHIEVQIFGDSHGNAVHLFERDCTLQRRHQKVIEEAPAPGMDAETREAVCGAAVRAAKAVDYVGAGTVEFIADGSGGLNADQIWFMEMNTRLQVEHPVTEMITGEDLVEWQLKIASGEPLPKTQDELSFEGWAMEARLYAENPATGFLPSTGDLDVLALPEAPVRVETGVAPDDSVSPFYDPMIAKLVTHGPNRDAARIALAKACDGVSTWPVHNNAGFLTRLLRHDGFADFSVTTGFIDAHQEALVAPPEPSPEILSYAANQLLGQAEPDVPAPWAQLRGFRLGTEPDLETQLLLDGEIVSTSLEAGAAPAGVYLYEKGDGAVLVQEGWPFQVARARHDALGADALANGAILSPMPGRVVSVSVTEGEQVQQGQTLVTLEAMKMEHTLTAPFDGTVTELAAEADAPVAEGFLLMQIKEVEDEE
ncbi:acetyl/propionyl/methylcrotonyl-CoA carboxylase subunit alpha [Henriciella aquimarina]|uniref:acetyl/propionyl/methylcrotonyl-CoA carboxylase subunit alpha n=1 Tax=Henriciella aquimarina TaxID=545261 RepID=UPI0009FD1C59|nr:acetyl/propionyl/methylcrotonyl-CoA carboxylase subunit alpha [Henriciella aquimarina]